MKTLFSLSITILLITTISCTKPKGVSTPDYCQATINGKQWQAGSSIPFTNYLSSNLSNSRRSLSISGSNDALQFVFIGIYDSNGINNNEYILNTDFKNNFAQYQDYNISYHYTFNTDSVYTGVADINLDSIKVNTSNTTSYIYRVHGTFHFRAKYDLNSDTVNVTHGAFSAPCVVSQ